MRKTEKILLVERSISHMFTSDVNVIMFRDVPEVWYEYYLGLYLELPTVVVVLSKDLTISLRDRLIHPLIKSIVETNEFDEKTSKYVADIVDGLAAKE